MIATRDCGIIPVRGVRGLDTSKPRAHGVLHRGELVDHFKVSRLIGRGGMGEVYLARDVRLGRKVALKIVRLEDPDTNRQRELVRILQEARVTARFNHPHIVTIHHVGVHKGRPYLALEYLDGKTLRDRMRDERLSTNDVVRTGLAVAEALAEAHRHGVLHRDLKPGNVMLPKDGRLRVVDFGVAKPVGDVTDHPSEPPGPPEPGEGRIEPVSHETPQGRVAGTPRYMAPEQWRGDACTGAADIWSLGVILFEMIKGEVPFEGATQEEVRDRVVSDLPAPELRDSLDVSPELRDLISRCLDKDPARRPSADDMARTLRGLLGQDRARPASQMPPFRGLLPFGEEHAELFFGRDAEVDAFLERLREEPVLAVVGPSGAGKSSFVQAGVVPRLREQGRWRVLRFRPGARPLEALAALVRRAQAGASESRLGSEFTPATAASIPSRTSVRPERDTRRADGPQAGPTDRDKGAEAAPGDAADTGADTRDLRERLRESPELLAVVLAELAEQQDCRVLLLVDQLEELYTLTGDEDVRRAFVQAIFSSADDPLGPVRVVVTLRDDFLGRAAETPLARRALGHIVVLRRPDPEALEEILVKPLEAVGFGYEDADLPREMLEAVRDEPACLPLLQFACARLWQRRDKGRRLLTRDEYDAVGGVSGALARHADEVLSGLSPEQVRTAREIFLRLVTPDGARRVVSMRALLDGLVPEAADVLQRLTEARAVVARKARSGDGERAELELVHESLVTSWKRLARWIEESREEVAFLDEVGQAAELWERRGCQEEELWRGAALQEALLRAARCSSIPDRVRRFLAAGEARDAQRTRRRRAFVAGTIAVLALVAIVLAVMVGEARREHARAEHQRALAEEQREQALAQRAEAQREGARGAFDRSEMLEARAKLRGSLETADSPIARALWWRLRQEPLVWARWLDAYLYHVTLSPDGDVAAVASSSKSVPLIDVRTLAVRVLRGSADHVFSVAFSPDGTKLAAGSWGRLSIWDLERGVARELRGHEGPIRSIAFSPDGAAVATAGSDSTVRVWSVSGGREPVVLRGHTGRVRSVCFSPGGDLLASASADATVRLWDQASAREVRVITGHTGEVSEVAFSPDGRTLASASMDGTVRMWSASDGARHAVLRDHEGSVMTVAYSADGRLLASGGVDQVVRLRDARTGAPVRALRGHSNAVTGVAFGPDGRHLVSSAYDETVRLWDLSSEDASQPPGGHTDAVHGLAFSPDDSHLASAGFDNDIVIWGVTSGEPAKVLRGHTGSVVGLDYSPDGRTLASASFDETVSLWDPATGDRDRVLWGHDQRVWVAAYSPDGSLVASVSSDGTVRLWDAVSGALRSTLAGSTHPGLGASFSPDGSLLALGHDDGTVRIWDVARGTLARELRGHDVGAMDASFDPGGQRLASAGADGTVRLWDLRTGRDRVLGRMEGRVYGVQFSPDGTRVGAASSDRLARIYDTAGGEPLVLEGHANEVNDIAFDHHGTLVATSSDDGTVRVWDAATGRPAWKAPVLLHDPVELYSHEGWVMLDGGAPAARAPDSASWRRAVEERARSAEQADGAPLLCIRTHDGSLELWDIARDRRLLAREVPGLARVVAVPAGCLAIARGEVSLHEAGADARRIAEGATVAVWSRGRILVAGEREVRVFGPDGALETSIDVGPGVTALAAIGAVRDAAPDTLVVGFEDGSVELQPVSSRRESRSRLPLEGAPASPVVRLLAGPAGSLAVSFANGSFGIWSLETGSRLYQVRLHGPVVHVLLRGSQLFIASELGQHAMLDLSVFERDHCDLMREVWDAVPVVWEDGHPVLRPPPRDHPCARSD